MLFDGFFVFPNSGSMFILKDLNLSDKVRNFLFQFYIFSFHFLISKRGWFYVFVDNFFYLNNFFYNFLYFNWSFDVDGLNFYLFFNFSCVF